MAKKFIYFDADGVIVSVSFSEDVDCKEDLSMVVKEGVDIVELLEGSEIFNFSLLKIHDECRVNVESKEVEIIEK